MFHMPISPRLRGWVVPLSCSLLLAAPALHAQPPPQAQIDDLRKQRDEQSQLLDKLRKAMGEQDARVRELQQALEAQQRDGQARAAPPAAATTEVPRTVQIGTAPSAVPDSPLSVPQLFDQPSVLTPKGMTILEPSLQYGYSSANRAALVGFTVIPAILIGLIDVREVRRNTTTATLTLRHGFSERFELEGRLPYVYRSDSTVSRQIFTAAATERDFHASGSGVGDIEATARYQL